MNVQSPKIQLPGIHQRLSRLIVSYDSVALEKIHHLHVNGVGLYHISCADTNTCTLDATYCLNPYSCNLCEACKRGEVVVEY